MNIAHIISAGVATTRLAALSRPRGPLVVMYHGLGGRDGVNPAAFSAHLDMLAARRRIVPLREAVDSIESGEAAGLAAVTFDDGYIDFETYALPVLASKFLHATLFVPAGRIGQSNDWDRGLASKRPILSEEALRALDPRHVEIGAHGWSHCRIRALPREALAREVAASRVHLEAASQREVRFFAYPYGQLDDFDAAAEAEVERSGYVAACSSHFGRSSSEAERFRIRRVGIEAGDGLGVVERKLDGAYDWVSYKERIGARWRNGPLANPRTGTLS